MTPEQAYFHCLEDVRNEELEKIIINDPRWAYEYARYVIQDRWIEAENIIATDSEHACRYALHMIRTYA